MRHHRKGDDTGLVDIIIIIGGKDLESRGLVSLFFLSTGVDRLHVILEKVLKIRGNPPSILSREELVLDLERLIDDSDLFLGVNALGLRLKIIIGNFLADISHVDSDLEVVIVRDVDDALHALLEDGDGTPDVEHELIDVIKQSVNVLVDIVLRGLESGGIGVVDVTLEVTLGESQLVNDVGDSVLENGDTLVKGFDLPFDFGDGIVELLDHFFLRIGEFLLELGLESLEFGLGGGNADEFFEGGLQDVVVELRSNLGHGILKFLLGRIVVLNLLHGLVQETERLRGLGLVSVKDGLVNLLVDKSLEVLNLVLKLLLQVVELTFKFSLERRIGVLVVLLDFGNVLLNRGDHGLEGIDLGVQVGSRLHSQFVHFLVNLLDVDFVVGTSSGQQCNSRKEQRRKFGEFNFHKVGIELRVNNLLNGAEHDAVQVVLLERLDAVAVAHDGDDAGLGNASLHEEGLDGGGTLVGQTLIDALVTGALVGVTGDGDVHIRVSFEPVDVADELGGFLVGDDGGIDGEEGVHLTHFGGETLGGSLFGSELVGSGLFSGGFLGGSLLSGELGGTLGFETGLLSGGGSLRSGDLGEVLGARTGGLAEVDLQTGEGVELEVRVTDFLGVELVAEDVVVHLEGEGDSVGQTEVSADTHTADRRNHVLFPQESEILLRIGLGDLGGSVVEAESATRAREDIRVEDALVVIGDEVSQVNDEIHVTLHIVEFVHLKRGDDVALALPAGSAEAKAEGRVELIPEGEGSGRGDQVLESSFADGVTGTALDLAEPVRIELHAGIGLALLRKGHLGAQRNGENQC